MNSDNTLQGTCDPWFILPLRTRPAPQTQLNSGVEQPLLGLEPTARYRDATGDYGAIWDEGNVHETGCGQQQTVLGHAPTGRTRS